MFKNATELLESEISLDFMRQIYYGVQNGTTIFKELVERNPELFNNGLSNNIIPKLVSFCINSQFSPEMYVSKDGFLAYIQTVNGFGYNVVVLENENLILHVAKVNRGNKLPSKAKYKLSLAKNNNFEEGQMQLNLWESGNNVAVLGRNYGVISYSLGKDYQVDSIVLAIPNTGFDSYLADVNIKEVVERIKSVDNDKQNEKTLITLKEKLIKEEGLLNISGDR